MSVETLPSALRSFAGEILDIDSHEMLPVQLWARELGPVSDDLANIWLHNGADINSDRNHPNVPGYVEDDHPIDASTIWRQKGSTAPGAADPSRRPAVMDLMGIKRQLMFPTAGMFGVFLTYLHPDYGYGKELKRDCREYGLELTKAYNKWGMKVARYSDRVRPVLPVFADSVEALMDVARELIDNGIRAIWMPSGMLPGGKSPAHPDLDPFWSLMEERDIAVCLHIGLDSKIFGTDEWSNAPAFEGFRALNEFRLDPWSMANQHITSQNFVLTMVLGGVFERHPMLRFGVVELGAGWIGPLCNHMDLWHHQDPGRVKGSERTTFRLPENPSFYVKRNIRVSGFDFEPFDTYMKHYGLEDVLCFASDYPHIEGGMDPIGRLYALLEPLGQEVIEKFFVANARWLLPD
jgi:predicted TIM-barrel fold metal-dependent hydrolase